MKQQQGFALILVLIFLSIFIGIIFYILRLNVLNLESQRGQKMADIIALTAANEFTSNDDETTNQTACSQQIFADVLIRNRADNQFAEAPIGCTITYPATTDADYHFSNLYQQYAAKMLVSIQLKSLKTEHIFTAKAINYGCNAELNTDSCPLGTYHVRLL